MPTQTRPTFPGVYTSVTDRSQGATPRSSRFHVGLVGPAEKGPFNVPTFVRTQREFGRLFGRSLDNSYLANAAAAVSNLSDGATVVRVGQVYTDVCNNGSGTKNHTKVVAVGFAERFSPGDYVRVRQIGRATTMARLSASAITDPDLPFVAGSKMADDYDGTAVIARSTVAGAANEAESFLYGTDWNTAIADVAACSIDSVETGYDPTVGAKNFFKFRLLVDGSDLDGVRTTLLANGGAVLKLSKSGKSTTREVHVREVEPVQTGVDHCVVTLDAVNNLRYGFQALPLQDTYGTDVATGASIQVKSGNQAKLFHMLAKTPGTWANSDGKSTGVWVTVSPGSAQDSKKIVIYENGAAAEVYDNLNGNPASTDFIMTRLAASSLVDFKLVGSLSPTGITRDRDVVTVVFGSAHNLAVNDWITIEGSDLPELNGSHKVTELVSGTSVKFEVSNYATETATSANEDRTQISPSAELMPANTIQGWNATTLNFATFAGGDNGEIVTDDSYIGTVDPVTEAGTGLRIFEDTDSVNVNVIWVSPVRYAGTPVAVWQKLIEVCAIQNASAPIDGDRGLTPRGVVDYTNATGAWTSRVKLDNYRLTFMWNWWKCVDPDTKAVRWLPPSIAKLRALAFTYDSYKPWYAAAGESRGLLPECLGVEFPTLSPNLKSQMYGGGQCVNPIIAHFERFMIWGNLTTQRTDSKLTADHAVHCVNHVMKSLADIGRRYVFDPNDSELLNLLDMDMREVLRRIKSERGIEDFALQIDSKNNTPDVRNRREVIVDLEFIPVDTAERIFVNATVRQSGATLNTLT